MPTTVELPSDRVYNECITIMHLDHGGHINITYVDTKTGDDIVMVYLGKEEIEQIVNLYMSNHDFIENEGKVKKDENPTPTPIEQPQASP